MSALADGILVVENDVIRRRFRWNGGHLATLELCDKRSDKAWLSDGAQPDVMLPGEETAATDGSMAERDIAATAAIPAHREVEVTCRLGGLWLKRVFRLFPGCPALPADLYLKGTPKAASWRAVPAAPGQLVNIEDLAAAQGGAAAPVLDRIRLGGRNRHLRLCCVRMRDVTDRRNTLVTEEHLLPYTHRTLLAGSLLLAEDLLDDERGLFLLKEGPSADVQLANPGFDFAVSTDGLEVAGIGLDPTDVRADEWTRGYGAVVGLAAARPEAVLEALRDYQKTLRTYRPERDFQILVNTWGDRGQDKRVCESFILKELDACNRLGATHFMIDDGWQAGHSSNSAFAGGSMENIWKDDSYWQPHPERFPNGLAPISARAKELGLRLGLWFGPAKDNDYENWQRDADALIGLHKEHGACLFKIDMVDLPTKTAEIRFRRFLDHVVAGTAGKVSFNLDVTAQRRGGYHLFREYGSLFLENRYTDWGNYHPHWTLRNLWRLSRYTAPRFLQIEFLNRWRNAEKYAADDPLAPRNVPFEYCAAVTLAAQPLAWFEASNLPEEAFAAAPLLRAYRELETKIHAARVFPIGDEPCGTGWTGFQILGDRPGEGLFLIYREWNTTNSASVKLWNIPAGTRLECRAAGLGAATDFTGAVDAAGRLEFTLPAPFSFGLWRFREMPA